MQVILITFTGLCHLQTTNVYSRAKAKHQKNHVKSVHTLLVSSHEHVIFVDVLFLHH